MKPSQSQQKFLQTSVNSLSNVRRYNIENWIKLWEKGGKHAGTILFGKSLINQIGLLHQELTKNSTPVERSAIGARRQFLGDLEDGFSSPNFSEQVLLLRHLCKQDVDDLIVALRAPRYECAHILPLLSNIKQAIESGDISSLLYREWSSERPNSYLIESLFQVMMRRGLAFHTSEGLQKWASFSLVHSYTQAWLRLHEKALVGDLKVQKALKDLHLSLLRRLTLSHIRQLKVCASASLFEVVPQRGLWENRMNYLMVEVADWLFSNLPAASVTSKRLEATQVSYLPLSCRNALLSLSQLLESADKAATEKYLCGFGKLVAHSYTKAFFIAAISSLVDVHSQRSPLRPLGQALNQFFATAGLFAPGKDRVFGNGHYYALDGAIKESLSEMCTRSCAQEMSDAHFEALGRSLLTSIVERWQQPLRDEGLPPKWREDSEENQTGSDTSRFLGVSGAFSAQDILILLGRRDTQNDWANHLSPILSRVMEIAPRIAKSVSARYQLRGDKGQLFWRQWKHSFSACLRYDAKDSIRGLNWAALGGRQFVSAIRTASSTIQPSLRSYAITVEIENLKSPHALYSVGTILFFDPIQFSFTHQEWTEEVRESILAAERAFEMEEEAQKQLPIRQRGGNRVHRLNVVFARVCVEAATASTGAQKGLELIRAAANTLGFAFSVSHSSMYGGLKPVIKTDSVLITKSDGGWTYQGSRTNRGYSVPHEGSRYRLTEFARAYDTLINTVARAPQSLTPLQNDFLRAIEWYIQGRWEPEATRRFLLYYVALEHIFLAGQGKKALSQTVLPAVHTTWRGLPIWTFINQSHDYAQSQVENNAGLKAAIQGDDQAKGWDLGPLPTPQQIRRVAEITRVFDSALATFFENYAQMLDEKFAVTQHIQAVIEDQRKDLGFRLYQLAAIRNGIVHEALNYLPGIDTASGELESILEVVLRQMSNEVVRFPVRIRTIEDMADHLQHPFG